MHLNSKKKYLSVLLCAIAIAWNTPYLKAAEKKSKLPSFTVTSNGSLVDELNKDKILKYIVVPITATSVLCALYDEKYKPLCKQVIKSILMGYMCDRSITLVHEFSHWYIAHLCGSDTKEMYVSAQFFGPGYIRRIRNESVPKETQLKHQIGISIAGPIGGLAATAYLGVCIKNTNLEEIPHHMMQTLIGYNFFIQIYNLTPTRNEPYLDGSKALENFATLKHIQTKSSLPLEDYKNKYYGKIPSQAILKGAFLLTTFLYPGVMGK